MSKRKPFSVYVWQAAAGQLESGFAICVEGSAAHDLTIARQQELARFIEASLNTAMEAFQRNGD